nr:InlB B-repeat-containing protein [Clostridia bacterium]
MKTKVFAVLVAVVMVMGMLPLSVSAAEVVVGSTAEMVTALASAAAGDVIKMKTGTYETFSVSADGVTITGETEDTVITVKSTTDTAFMNIAGHNVTVKGLKIVVPATTEGDKNWITSVIGFDTTQWWYGGIEPNGWNVIDCEFVNQDEQIATAIFNVNEFVVDGCSFTNFETGICVMNDGSAPDTIEITDNTFTYVDYPVSGYWGGEGDESVISITGNEFVSPKTEDAVISVSINDYATGLGKDTAINTLIIDNNIYTSDAEVLLVNSGADMVIEQGAAENVKDIYQNVRVNDTTTNLASDIANENAKPNRVFYLNYGTDDEEVVYVTEDGDYEYETVVSFNNSDIADVTVTLGTLLEKPADPTRYRYIFAGWYTDPACTEAYDFTKPVTGAITLYAKWTDDVELNNRLMINALTTSLFRNFSVRATANEGGTLTNEGLVFTMFNNPLKYKATPDEGYEVVSFIVDGVDLGPIDEYRFDYISANHTVEVVFAPITDADA